MSDWGIKVTVRPSSFDESSLEMSSNPASYVLDVARSKMDALKDLMQAGQLWITADTIVHLDDKIMGKPQSEQEAKNMLQTLSGKTHVVSTAYVLGGLIEKSRVVDTRVTFGAIEDQVLDLYVRHANYQDKAGAYGIQKHAAMFVKAVEGSLTNVIGLPMEALLQDLFQEGVLS